MPMLPGWVLHCPGKVHYCSGGGKRRGMLGELHKDDVRKLMSAVAMIAVTFSLDADASFLTGMHRHQPLMRQ